MKIVNLTPHALNLYRNGEQVEEIPSAGFVRAAQKNAPIGELNGYPVSRVSYGEVSDMPDPEPDTVYVVSQITAQALKSQGRTDDVYIVDGFVRNDAGQIIGCTGFAKV